MNTFKQIQQNMWFRGGKVLLVGPSLLLAVDTMWGRLHITTATSSSAVANRPHVASCHWIFR